MVYGIISERLRVKRRGWERGRNKSHDKLQYTIGRNLRNSKQNFLPFYFIPFTNSPRNQIRPNTVPFPFQYLRSLLTIHFLNVAPSPLPQLFCILFYSVLQNTFTWSIQKSSKKTTPALNSHLSYESSISQNLSWLLFVSNKNFSSIEHKYRFIGWMVKRERRGIQSRGNSIRVSREWISWGEYFEGKKCCW